jgi:hypothetical protein
MASPVGGMPQDDFLQPKSSRPNNSWQNFLQAVHDQLQFLTTSGTTANRPTKGLFVGRHYFDTTLGFEIHFNGTQWVKYDGTAA